MMTNEETSGNGLATVPAAARLAAKELRALAAEAKDRRFHTHLSREVTARTFLAMRAEDVAGKLDRAQHYREYFEAVELGRMIAPLGGFVSDEGDRMSIRVACVLEELWHATNREMPESRDDA